MPPLLEIISTEATPPLMGIASKRPHPGLNDTGNSTAQMCSSFLPFVTFCWSDSGPFHELPVLLVIILFSLSIPFTFH